MDHPAIALLLSLMSIPSTSNNEHQIASFLSTHLKSLNYTVESIPISQNSSRCNIYAYLGTTRKTRILLTAHMDTVPPHIPPTVNHITQTIHGRGSSDDLGPLVAQIFALEELRTSSQIQEGDVGIVFVVGEENGGHGMLAVNSWEGLSWEAGIFAEPTQNKLAKGHKGQLVFEIIAEGRACHSGYPELGTNAISSLLAVLNELSATNWGKDLLGKGTFNIGRIEGGEKHNILAGEAKALCEVRVVEGLEWVKGKVRGIVEKYKRKGVRLEWIFEYPGVLLEWKGIEGFEAEAVSFGTDIPRLKEGMCGKRVLYGPGSILVAHGREEFIEVKELVESIEGYKKLVMHFLK
ncbi:hypothetical protein QBC38DRAFT_271167 [Podospora fimiseda]|uniref:Peptidase M20 dimerisation domain-containing protein n=1 Tax=Podospora fimiseda TaxID=252190 RepID=A0AAN7BL02_9PEZI|nr:hypothetical protein QBC38DRAFT_271167 [Podospora fimiseda]